VFAEVFVVGFVEGVRDELRQVDEFFEQAQKALLSSKEPRPSYGNRGLRKRVV